MSLLDWFLEPLIGKPSDNIPTIPIKEEVKPTINIHIPDVQIGSFSYNKSFRPTKLDHYIGQEKAKILLKAFIEGSKQYNRPFPHILIHGPPGGGKSTLVRLLAGELKVPISELLASDIVSKFQLFNKLQTIDGGVLFLDELHSMEREQAESLYLLMEDFKLGSKDITPFTLAGATTELGEILKTRKPLYDRFKIVIELENYTVPDIAKIATQYILKTYNHKYLNTVIEELASNSRLNPRSVIKLSDAYVLLKDIKVVLSSFNILKEGFTNNDLKVLELLTKHDKGVGLQTISSYMNTSEDNYLYVIEPYLLQSGLILRTARGRKISDLGKAKLKELST